MGRRSILRTGIVAVAAVAMIVSSGTTAAFAAKKGPALSKDPAAMHTPVQMPEITRIGVFQNQGSERFLLSPLALVRDPQNGDLIITSFEAGELIILDRNGALIKRLGRESGVVTPYGIAMDEQGVLYLSEVKSGYIKVLSPSGMLLDEFELSSVLGRDVAPGRIMFGGDGLLYVSDLNQNVVLVITRKGALVRSFGPYDYLQKAGTVGEGKQLALSAQGTAVWVYDSAGQLLKSFGEHGDAGEKNVSFPSGFAVDAKGRLWVADAFQHRLKVFTLDGKFLFNFGRLEEKDGGFFFPVDLCFGGNGELFVLEKGAGRVQVFLVEDLKEAGHGKR